MDTLTELSLFSGYGGFSMGLRLASLNVRTVGYVEIDKYCQQLIQARIRDGFLDDAPIWPDIRAFDGEQCRGLVDIITAGFPCQPHSVAGQRRGEADERNLWPDTRRVVREVGPRFVLLENVPGILANGYAGTVVGQLSAIGYDCIWDCVPAASVGAPHLRWRWWTLAYARHSEQPGRDELQGVGRQRGGGGDQPRSFPSPRSSDVADAEGEPRALRPAAGERPETPGVPESILADSGQFSEGWGAATGEAARGGPLGQPPGPSWWAVIS